MKGPRVIQPLRCTGCGQDDPYEFEYEVPVKGFARGYTSGITTEGAIMLGHGYPEVGRSSAVIKLTCMKCRHEQTSRRRVILK